MPSATMKVLSRRALLSGVAGTAISLPWLEAMLPSGSARAAVAKPPLRFVAFLTNGGTFPERFWPRLPGEALYPLDKQPTPGFVSADGAGADSSDFVFSPGLEPLSRHKRDLLIVEGLDASGGPGHDQWPSMLSGRKGRNAGISLDQAIANQIAGDTKFKSLQLGTKTDNGIAFSFYDLDKPALAENNPQAVFDRIFADVAPPDANTASALERIRTERKSVLDASLAEITDLQRSLGRADREKLQNYFDSIREVELRLDSKASGAACGRPNIKGLPENEWWLSDTNAPLVLGSQFDLLSMAFACDLSRVATVSIGNANCDMKEPYLGIARGRHDGLGHALRSDMEAQNMIAKIDAWNAEQLASFIDRLKAIPEGVGTVFDNTLILWVQELTTGDHDTENMPHVLAGSAQGHFKTGRYLRVARQPSRRGQYETSGRWSNDLKVSVLQSMGVAAQTFGDAAHFGSALELLRG